MRPDDVLSAIAGDITQIRSDSAWAYHHGYQPHGPNPDRVTGQPRDIIGRDDDTVSPTTFDIGVGDPASRRAYRETGWLVTFIDVRTVRALTVLDPEYSKLFIVTTPTTGLASRDRALTITAMRLATIADVWAAADRRQHSNALKELAAPHTQPPSARAAADQAVRILNHALTRGPLHPTPTTKTCAICQTRPTGERCGPRCATCAQWKWRHGTERPTVLDADELTAPHAAAARRRARNEGFGDS